MEEINDLEVAVWIQDPTTKEIFNSRFLYEYTDHPYPVQNLNITDAGNLTIRWTPSESANPTGYNVYVNNEKVASNITVLNYTIANELDFYTVEVEALYGEKTSVKAVKLLSTDFAIPQGFTATLNEKNVEMSWTGIENAEKYNIYRNGVLINTVAETEYIDNTLTTNDMYCYQVSAIYGDYESALSIPSCITYQGENISELETSFVVTPNPVNDYMTISGNNINGVTIYNNIGVMVDKFDIEDNNIKIDMRHYNSGLYVIIINAEEGSVVKKVIKR
jgi:hypothetical protein